MTQKDYKTLENGKKALFRNPKKYSISKSEQRTMLICFFHINSDAYTDFLIEIFIKVIVNAHTVIKKIQRDPCYTLTSSSQWKHFVKLHSVLSQSGY